MYESFGSFEGALYIYQRIASSMPLSSGFEDVLFRCAAVMRYMSTLEVSRTRVRPPFTPILAPKIASCSVSPETFTPAWNPRFKSAGLNQALYCKHRALSLCEVPINVVH